MKNGRFSHIFILKERLSKQIGGGIIALYECPSSFSYYCLYKQQRTSNNYQQMINNYNHCNLHLCQNICIPHFDFCPKGVLCFWLGLSVQSVLLSVMCVWLSPLDTSTFVDQHSSVTSRTRLLKYFGWKVYPLKLCVVKVLFYFVKHWPSDRWSKFAIFIVRPTQTFHTFNCAIGVPTPGWVYVHRCSLLVKN